MTDSTKNNAILELNQKLLNAIVSGDYTTYSVLCSKSITCFEAETNGYLVQGLPFHKYYFDLPSTPSPIATNVSMSNPHVRWLGDDAVVLSYTRLNQIYKDGSPVTAHVCETRVWQRGADGSHEWKNVHVHRS